VCKKIFHMLPGFLDMETGGGVVTSVKGFVARCVGRSTGLENIIISWGKSAETNFAQDLTKVRYFKAAWLAFFFVLRDKVIFQKDSLIYCHSFFSPNCFILIVLCNFLGKKIIVNPRGEFQNDNIFIKKTKKILVISFWRLLNRIELKSRELPIFCGSSQEEIEDIRKYLGPTVRTRLVRDTPELLDVNSLRKTNTSLTDFDFPKKNKDQTKYFIGVVGRIAPEKNLELAIEVLAASPKLELIVIGSGPTGYLNKLLRLAKERLVEGRITWCGFVKKPILYAYMMKCDAIFVPSFAESYSHVIADSIQLNLPVVATQNSPWRNVLLLNGMEIFDPGENIKTLYPDVARKLAQVVDQRWTNRSVIVRELEFIPDEVRMLV
jgi:glycosyltransferase involved in cell wall biosynthesis